MTKVVVMALVYSSVLFAASMEVPPLLWRPSPVQVTKSHEQYLVLVHLVSPCKILTKNILHPDILNVTIEQCNDLYDELFVQPIQKMCPYSPYEPFFINSPKHFASELESRKKRELFTIIICLVLVATVALSTAGTVTGAKALQNTHQLQTEIEKQEEELQDVQKQLEISQEAIKVLQSNVKVLGKGIHDIDEDLNNVKKFLPSTTLALSYITTRLTQGQSFIREAARQMRDHKLYAPLFDFFNVTLKCGDSCPLKNAVAKSCYVTHDSSRLYLDFTIPVVDNDLQLLEADPFDLMVRKDNQTCSIVYNGPENAIVSKAKDCVYSVNVRHRDVLLTPDSTECKSSYALPDTSKYFKLGNCKATQPDDETEFIQVKQYHNNVYVYCYLNNITIGGKLQPCTNETMIIPHGLNFSINDRQYRGHQVNLEHFEKLDPTYSKVINWHLEPHVNMNDIMEDVAIIHKTRDFHKKDSHDDPVVPIIIIILAVISSLILILSIVFTIKKCAPSQRNTSIRIEPMRARYSVNDDSNIFDF